MYKKGWVEQTAKVMGDKRLILVTISISQLWLTITAIQATTRHPALGAATVKQLRQIAEQMSEAIIEEHPEAKELLASGWNPKFDVPNRKRFR